MGPTIRTRPYRLEVKPYLRVMYGRGLAKRVLWLVIFIMVVAGTGAAFFGPSFATGLAIPLAIFLPFLFVVRWVVLSASVRNPKNRHVVESERTAEFGPNGVHVTTSDGLDSRSPWSHYVSAEVHPGLTLLFITAIQHVVIPSSAFQSPQDEVYFHQMLRDRGLLK